MKILHIVGSLDKSAGGPSRSVPQTCEQLSKRGINIQLVAHPSKNPVNVNSTSTYKVTFKTTIDLILFGLKISKKEVSLIHLQHIWTPYIHIMARMARIKGIPYIITPRGMLEPWIMQRHPFKKQLAMFLYQRRDLKKAAAIHATCEMEKQNVQKLGFNNPVTVIPNGINLSTIPVPKSNYGTKKIIFLSRIHLKKGIELLLEAWQKINNNEWELEIAGEGEPDYISKLESEIKAKRITNVSFVGAQYGEAKWSFMKSGDVFILPTFSENFGIVVAEALICGVPVITTTGTPWHELETNNCGWWIDLSIENLTKALLEAINTKPEDLKTMGQRGRKLIKTNYDIHEVAKRIENVYQQILAKESLPTNLN